MSPTTRPKPTRPPDTRPPSKPPEKPPEKPPRKLRHVTDEWLAESIARTRAEQGLPPKVTDPVALDQIATLHRPWLDERREQEVTS